MMNCMPHQPVNDILFLGCIQGDYRDTSKYKLKFLLNNYNQDSEEVQIRCVRLSSSDRFEIMYPECCSFELSDIKIANFKPLPYASSLKKRAD